MTIVVAPIRHTRAGAVHLWYTWDVLANDGTEVAVYHIACGQRRRTTVGGSFRVVPDLTYGDRYTISAVSCQKCRTRIETEPTT